MPKLSFWVGMTMPLGKRCLERRKSDRRITRSAIKNDRSPAPEDLLKNTRQIVGECARERKESFISWRAP